MDKIAFIIGETFVYWNSIILAFAAAAAICVFLSVYLGSSGDAFGAAAVVPMAILSSIVLSRLVHWYCRADSYESMAAALTDYSSGGFALIGVFAGCLLSACLLRLIRVVKSLPRMLDAMALAGAAGIAIGRLACFYNTTDRGMLLTDITQLPLAYPVVNAVTGETEMRLATFALQSMVTGGIFVLLFLIYLVGKAIRKTYDGDICLLFLLLYGASQVVLDSTRYDSLFLRSNGFVSIVQILAAVGMAVTIVVFSVRMVQCKGWKWWYILLWVMILASLGCAGYMEYHVQRHGDEALFAYTVMSGCLIIAILTTIVIRLLAAKRYAGKYLQTK